MTLMDRRRALMMVGSGGNIANGLVDGIYANGAVSITVSNNKVLTFGSTTSGFKTINIPFIHPFELHAGDIVVFDGSNPSGYINVNVPTSFNDNSYLSGNFNPYNNPATKRTVTITSDITVTSLKIQPQGTMANSHFTLSILVNGEEILNA